jgi:hypothetical protein
VLDLTPDGRPASELRDLARLLSGRQIEDVGGAAAAEFATEAATWSKSNGKCAELPGSSSETAATWNSRKAAAAEAAGRWFAAVVHLDPLVAAAPEDGSLRIRRGEALGRIGRLDRAAVDFAHVGPSHRFHPDVIEAIAVLAAWRRDAPTFEAIGARITDLFAPGRGLAGMPQMPEQLRLLSLAPATPTRTQQTLAAAESGARAAPGDPVWLAVRGEARYRSGDFEGASDDLRESLAAYGRKLKAVSQPTMVGANGDSIVIDSAAVTPACNEGTPREWSFLAMVERRLGHTETARAWLAKTSLWLELATRDPPDPAALGGLADPGMRAILRMTAGVRMNPILMGQNPRFLTEPYLGSWRQLLALKVLVREATAMINGADELPSDVFGAA